MKDKNINIYEYLSNSTNILDEIKQTRLESASKIYNDSVNIWEFYHTYRRDRDINQEYISITETAFQIIKNNEKYLLTHYIISYKYKTHLHDPDSYVKVPLHIKYTLEHSRYIKQSTAMELISSLELRAKDKKEIYTEEEIETLSNELLKAIKMADKIQRAR